MPLEYVTSQNGKQQLVVDGFIFTKEREFSNKKYWKCVEHWKFRCLGRCHTEGQTITNHTAHNHTPRAALIHAKSILNEMKTKSRETCENPKNIIATASAVVTEAVAGKLPSISQMKRTLQRARRKENMTPMNPVNLVELEIPQRYTITSAGEKFLQFDSGPSNERILIFTTDKNLDALATSQHWYADGTFKSAPTLFYQVYTIHGICSSTVVPLVYTLLPKKDEITYTRLLAELKILRPGLNPVSVMTDFETAVINAFNNEFPNIESRGCFFHFTQSVWRRIQQDPDILHNYTTNPDFALKLRHLVALAFVPTQLVIAHFEKMQESMFFVQHEILLQPLINYFEDTWIGRPTRRGTRREPLFCLSKWNCFDAIVNDIAKTNNSVEGWHRGFSSLLGNTHPTIWKLIDAFKKEESLNRLKQHQLLAGQPPDPSRKLYKDLAERLKAVVSDFGAQSELEYLSSISQNIDYNV